MDSGLDSKLRKRWEPTCTQAGLLNSQLYTNIPTLSFLEGLADQHIRRKFVLHAGLVHEQLVKLKHLNTFVGPSLKVDCFKDWVGHQHVAVLPELIVGAVVSVEHRQHSK